MSNAIEAAKTAPYKMRNQSEVGSPNKFQELLKEETVPVPAHLAFHDRKFSDDDIAIERYTSHAFFDQELKKMWTKVWQFVCREEQIPNAGDHVVYDLGDMSFIVMRGNDGEIRAFYNSCLHRGRALRMNDGHVKELKCPYHGFTWSVNGAMASIPCEWDFKHMESRDNNLPQALVDSWNGFVFINPDLNAISLQEYMGVFPDHFKDYNFERSYVLAHVRREVTGNWKVVQEAFMESFHAHVTHPQLLTNIADADSQYDCYGDNISRSVSPSAVPSPHIYDVTQERILFDTLNESGRMAASDGQKFELPEGMTARQYMAKINREMFGAALGRDLSHATMAELQDAILYSIFPNTQIWAGWGMNLVYRVIPNGKDVDSCIFDVMLMGRYKEGEERPKGAQVTNLKLEQSFGSAPELAALGPVFDQDIRNLDCMAKGLRASKKGTVSLASYQEARIRHMHETLDKYLDAAE
jgi:phenylpropionate dioxygenase-like ring-hydroxylating dioxygenase large terminal subunit